MKRFARETSRWCALGLLAVLGLACSAGPKMRPSEATDVANTQPVLLSLGAPTAETVPASVSGTPQTLQLEVSRIDNPTRQAFSIAVSFMAAAPIMIGSVALYPPDQPARLTLLVPPAAQAAIAATQPPRFRVSLQPVANDRPLVAPLQISVSLLALGPG